MNINDVKLTDAEKQAIIDTDFDAFEPFDGEFHEPVWVPAITAVENLRRADGSRSLIIAYMDSSAITAFIRTRLKPWVHVHALWWT